MASESGWTSIRGREWGEKMKKRVVKSIPRYWDCENCGNIVSLMGDNVSDKINMYGICENCGSSYHSDYHSSSCECVRKSVHIPEIGDIADIVCKYIQTNPGVKLEANNSYEFGDQEYFYIKTIMDNNYNGWIFKKYRY